MADQCARVALMEDDCLFVPLDFYALSVFPLYFFSLGLFESVPGGDALPR